MALPFLLKVLALMSVANDIFVQELISVSV